MAGGDDHAGEIRWEGPARAIVRGALVFPGHASLWIRDQSWGGRLYIDAYAPLEGQVLELEVRGEPARRSILVEEIANRPGIQSSSATVVRFRGDGLPPRLPRDSVGPI